MTETALEMIARLRDQMESQPFPVAPPTRPGLYNLGILNP